MKKNMFLFLLILCYITAYSQTKQEETSLEISKKFLSNLSYSSIKDSIAVYTLAIKVNVLKKSKYTVVTNNDAATRFFPKLGTFLEGIDFSVFGTRGKKTNYVIPIAIIVTDYNGSTQFPSIIIWDLHKNLEKLFLDTSINNLYLKPIIIRASKTTYN